MALDVAKFVIAAQLDGVAGSISGMKLLEGAVGGVAKALALFGGSVALAWQVLDWAKSTVSAASALDDLSDATGASVENLSRLANQAAVSGKPFEELQSLMLKLSSNMGGVDESSRRAQKAMELLGVSTRDPAAALNEIAVKLNEYRDGVEKAALARDLFGKGGPAFLATLKDIAETQDLGATVSKQQAAEAERLEKEFRRLGVEATSLKDVLLSKLVPALASTLEAFRLARAHGLSFSQSLDFIGDTSMESIGSRLKQVRSEMDSLKGTIENARAVEDDPYYGAQARVQIVHATKALEELTKVYQTLQDLQRRGALRGAATLGDLGDQTDRLLQRMQPRAPASLEEAKASVSEFQRMLDQVKQKAAEVQFELDHAFDTEPITAAEKELAKLVESDAYKRLSSSDQIKLLVEYNELIEGQKELARTKKGLDDVAKAEKDLADTRAKAAALNQRELDDLAKMGQSLEERLGQLKREGEEIGLTKEELARLTLARIDDEIRIKQQTLAGYENVEGMDAQAEALRTQINLLHQIRDQAASNQTRQAIVDQAKTAADEWNRAAQQIESSLTDALLRGFESGADMAKNFRDTLVNMFKTLVLRPIIQAILAPVSGSLAALLPTGASASPLGGGAGGAGDLMSLLSSGASLFGGGGTLFGSSLAGGGIFASGLGATFATSGIGEALGLTVAMGAGEGMALTALGSMLGTAIPVIGAVIAIAALAGAFSKDPSKVRGQFGIQSGTGGFEDNAFLSSVFGNLGFLDSGTQQFSGEAAQVFNKLIGDTLAAFAERMSSEQITRLTGTLQGTNFGEFSGEYTTQDFLQKYGGEIMRKVISAAFGELDPALQAVFDGFEGTADEMSKFANVLLTVHDLTKDIPTDLRATLIAALDGTEAVSEQVVAFAQAYATLQAVMNRDPVEDALTAIANASDSAYVKLGRTADAFEALIEAYDGSADASKEIAQATADYYNALVNVIAGIRSLRTSIEEMFNKTIEDFSLETMTDDEKKIYYQQRVADLRLQLGTATDPAEIERLSQQINAYMREAFGLLTPDEQRATLDQWIEYARQVNELAQERLQLAEAAAQARADELFTNLREVLTAAANDFKAASADQKVAAATAKLAADTLLQAARTPLEIVIPENTVNA